MTTKFQFMWYLINTCIYLTSAGTTYPKKNDNAGLRKIGICR